MHRNSESAPTAEPVCTARGISSIGKTSGPIRIAVAITELRWPNIVNSFIRTAWFFDYVGDGNLSIGMRSLQESTASHINWAGSPVDHRLSRSISASEGRF